MCMYIYVLQNFNTNGAKCACIPTYVLQGFCCNGPKCACLPLCYKDFDAMEQNAHAYLWVAIFLHMTTFKVRVKVITTTHNAKENQENVIDMQLSNMSMQMG